jgi:hypothetical protein
MDRKANINVLADDLHFDPISGGTPNRLFPCEVKRPAKEDAHSLICRDRSAHTNK